MHILIILAVVLLFAVATGSPRSALILNALLIAAGRVAFLLLALGIVAALLMAVISTFWAH